MTSITPTLCIYHGGCTDGFAAAWAIWKRWPNCRFHAGTYGAAPPAVDGEHVLLVDFSYKAPLLADGTIGGVFDMERSGAVLAWHYAHPGEPLPALLAHVEDHDLWRHALLNTREIVSYLMSFGYDFSSWDSLIWAFEDREARRHAIAGGTSILRKHIHDVTELSAITQRPMWIGGHRVPVANLPKTMASDAGHLLAEDAPFGATYFDTPTGRVFSLRSRAPDGIDVSEIAKAYGGGGHRHAAGFTAPRNWEGDDSVDLAAVMEPFEPWAKDPTRGRRLVRVAWTRDMLDKLALLPPDFTVVGMLPSAWKPHEVDVILGGDRIPEVPWSKPVPRGAVRVRQLSSGFGAMVTEFDGLQIRDDDGRVQMIAAPDQINIGVQHGQLVKAEIAAPTVLVASCGEQEFVRIDADGTLGHLDWALTEAHAAQLGSRSAGEPYNMAGVIALLMILVRDQVRRELAEAAE